MHLLSPILSYMQPGKMYGQKGDEVTVISIHHQVAIVENTEGGRYPAPVDCLSESPVAKSATQVGDTIPVSKKVTKTKRIIQPQNQLF